MAEFDNSLFATNRAEWRDWLDRHQSTTQDVWLVIYKKHTGRPSVAYREALEEALCFGWVDGLRKRIDDERYACRFSPRKAGSKWSPLNIRLAEGLIQSTRMTQAGLAAFEQRVLYDEKNLQIRSSTNVAVPPYVQTAFAANGVVWENFQNLAPGYRKQYILWIDSAKREATREQRIKESIELLKKNQKLGLK